MWFTFVGGSGFLSMLVLCVFLGFGGGCVCCCGVGCLLISGVGDPAGLCRFGALQILGVLWWLFVSCLWGEGVFQVCLGWLFLWAYWFADFGGLAYCDTSGFGPGLLCCYGLDELVGLIGCVVLVLALRVGILGLLFCVAVWLCILLLGLGVVGWLVLVCGCGGF